MRELVSPDNIYSTRLGHLQRVIDSEMFYAIEEIYNNLDIKPESSKYYKMMEGYIGKIGHAFGWVESEEQKLARVQQVKDLVKSLQENGYNRDLEKIHTVDGFEFGRMSARKVGNIYDLIDGHHR